jgi:polar amino acid transport system substrate-binding protein/glutamate/aspartate transport system substrate-binding protein
MGTRILAAAFCGVLLLLSAKAQAATLDRIRESGAINLGYRSDAAPFSYVNKNGQVDGYSVTLCEAVAGSVRAHLQRDDIKVNFVEVTAENRFEAVQSGEIDLLCSADTITLARREIVDFSLMTFVTGSSVLFRKDGPADFAGLAGKKVGVRAGTTTESGLKNALAEAGITADIVAVKDHDDGRRALEASEIAAYFADRAILVLLAANAKEPQNLALSNRFFSYEPYGLVMQRGDADFRLLVDAALVRLIRSQAMAKVYNATFGNAAMSDLLRAMYTLQAYQE